MTAESGPKKVATNPVASPADPAASQAPGRSIAVRRFAFVAKSPAGMPVRREFTQPRRMVAVEGAADSTDPFDVVIVPPDGDGPLASQAAEWMAQSDRSDADLGPTTIKLKSGAIVEWSQARAIIRGPAGDADDLLTALIDFAFFDRELIALEAVVGSHEDQAPNDAGRSHRISRRDRAHWVRIGETIELLTRSRLTFARLEAIAVRGSRDLSPAGRRLMAQLVDEADTEARLESLTGRLEALEDLYEGANDRIADFRGWHKGQVLEIAIVVLLVLEIILMTAEMSLRSYELIQERSASEADSVEVKSPP